MLGLFAIGACRIPPADTPDPDVVLTTPAITSLEVTCLGEEGAWRVDLIATSWTGGARTWWTTDGAYVETHLARSRGGEPDGSGDTLRLDLDMVADWRDVVRDVSTAFRCPDHPSLRVELYDPDGEAVDCSSWGDHPELLDGLEDVPACP